MTNIMLSALVFGLGSVTALYKLSLLLLLFNAITTDGGVVYGDIKLSVGSDFVRSLE